MGIIDGDRETLQADRDEYYHNIHVHESTCYTLREALLEERRTGWHSGPWKEEYRKLTREHKE